MSQATYHATILALLITALADPSRAEPPHPLTARPQPWQRRSEPILSARTTKQAWCKVVLYSPHVIYHDGKFRMWYLGTSTATRTNDIVLGYAESTNGIDWKPHTDNPILTAKDIPWGDIWQTPFVLFDRQHLHYKMWFVSGKGVLRDDQNKVIQNDQRLGYAHSRDGIHWQVHPKSIYPSGRSPSVIKEGPHRYRMWMGSSPTAANWDDLYKHIYEFTSTDGLSWQRSPLPLIQPSGHISSTVYPFVLKEKKSYTMWYGGHIAGGQFELFAAHSKDGTHWNIDHRRPVFPAAPGKTAFDSRYTSTPCVVDLPDRYLLYYSARDWNTEYIDSQGQKRRDNSSPYSHIDVAVIEKQPATK